MEGKNKKCRSKKTGKPGKTKITSSLNTRDRFLCIVHFIVFFTRNTYGAPDAVVNFSLFFLYFQAPQSSRQHSLQNYTILRIIFSSHAHITHVYSNNSLNPLLPTATPSSSRIFFLLVSNAYLATLAHTLARPPISQDAGPGASRERRRSAFLPRYRRTGEPHEFLHGRQSDARGSSEIADGASLYLSRPSSRRWHRDSSAAT